VVVCPCILAAFASFAPLNNLARKHDFRLDFIISHFPKANFVNRGTQRVHVHQSCLCRRDFRKRDLVQACVSFGSDYSGN
jgi:hypothetical protein